MESYIRSPLTASHPPVICSGDAAGFPSFEPVFVRDRAVVTEPCSTSADPGVP